MSFRTKLDYSDNRQIQQRPETHTILSGGTAFGVTFSALTTGPDLLTSGITSFVTSAATTFSGNSATTVFNWYDPSMELGYSSLTAITPSTSANTQYATGYSANTTTIIDGNTVVLDYVGVEYDITCSNIYDLGGGNYSGTALTLELDFLTAKGLDFTGRTIWNDVSGITRTENLIITNNPVIGNVWMCVDSEGRGYWSPISAASTTNIWISGTGINSAILNGSGGLATGGYSVVEGRYSYATGDTSHAEGSGTTAFGDASHSEGYQTTASGFASHAQGLYTKSFGNYSHTEGQFTTAIGSSSHAEGDSTRAMGYASHTEGIYTTAIGTYSHAQGNQTIASGQSSHAEGEYTTALGAVSHASGYGSIASGITSFVHGNNSVAGGTGTIVLGDNITGTTDNTTYVNLLNIKNVGSTAFANDIRIDANGNLTTNTSDERLKENITPLSGALATIQALKGVSYQWKDRNAGTDAVKLGFIAQQVNSVDSRLAFTNPVDGYMGLHIDGVIPLLVEAVKELASGSTVINNSVLQTQTVVAEDNNIDLNFGGTQQTAIDGGIKVLHAKGINSSAEFIIDENGDWTTNNDLKPKQITIPLFTPSGSTDTTGGLGNITRDDAYIYIKCSDGWKRSNLESF